MTPDPGNAHGALLHDIATACEYFLRGNTRFYRLTREATSKRETKGPERGSCVPRSLARHWHNKDWHAEACNVLAPVYGNFPADADSMELREVRALLEALKAV